jgi:hypothetical protein
MGIPEDDRNPDPHAYGAYNPVSADGKYFFEWTPFTPAIVAWRNAENHLRRAQDKLVDARKIKGFAIPGLEAEHRTYVKTVEVLAEDVDRAAKDANTVAQVLDAANTSYAAAADASRQEYELLRSVVDGVLVSQDRLPKPRERAGGV